MTKVISSVIRRLGWLGMTRAPGGKAGSDSPSVHRDTSRLVAFSDAVFAITITLLILEIRRPTNDRHLLHGLVTLWPSYLAYADPHDRRVDPHQRPEWPTRDRGGLGLPDY